MRALDHISNTISTIGEQKSYVPPYCPSPECDYHHGTSEKFYSKNGFAKTEKPPHVNQRYICKECGTQFSYNTFSIDFRTRFPGIGKIIFKAKNGTMSNGSIARMLNVTENIIRQRHLTMTRQAILIKSELESKARLKLREPIAYDGFETFSYSQYEPCYINNAVGKDSLYSYMWTFSPLNRKGRRTAIQEVKNRKLIAKFGKFPPSSIKDQTIYTVKELLKISESDTLVLHTDEHRSYQDAIQGLNKTERMRVLQILTNSKERRDAKNNLFAANHLHMRYRHFTASNKRETIAFNKHCAALMENITLQTISKDFMEPKIYNKGRWNKKHRKVSPAMHVGVTDKILTFEDFFNYRRQRTQFKLREEESNIYARNYPYSRHKIQNQI